MASSIIFKQLFDQTSATYSYLLAEKGSRQAVFIDTVYEQHERDLSLLRELDLELLACLETHCHADHVTGACYSNIQPIVKSWHLSTLE